MKDEYHTNDAVSHTKLERFRARPALYASPVDSDTPAMRFGRALHCYVLTPTEFQRTWAVGPEGAVRKDSKAWKEFEAANVGREVVSSKEMDTIERIAAQISIHSLASTALVGGIMEKIYRTPRTKFGFQLQCRTDCFQPTGRADLIAGMPFVADIKTIACLDDFPKAYHAYGYHRQAAFYLDVMATCGVMCQNFLFVVCEKEAPFGVMVRYADSDSIAVGRRENAADLERLSECIRLNQFPSGDETLSHVGLPAWYAK